MPHSLKPGDEIVPGYVLVRRLGAGGSGEVWVSRASGGVQVAIKILSDLAMIASDRELEALRIVREAKHPNLCPLFGVWFFDDDHNLLSSKETESILGMGDDMTETVCLAPAEERESSAEFDSPITETVALSTRKTKPAQMIVAMGLGEQTLMDRLVQVQAEKEEARANEDGADPAADEDQPRGIDPQELMRYMKSAASAIDELNERHSIYHCDIKPQNILLVGGQAQVCDFGLARKVEDSRKTTVAFGTPAYGAPEMLFERTYSKTIDQYSLAVTYYELRTGRLPYSSVTQTSLLRSKATGEVDLSRIPPAERQVLAKAIDLDPKQRYENCQSLVTALEEAINDPDAVLSKSAAAQRNQSVPLAVGGLLIALAAIGSWWLFGSSEAEPQAIASTEIADIAPVTSTDIESAVETTVASETSVAEADAPEDPTSNASPSSIPEPDAPEPSDPASIINDQLLAVIEADTAIDQRLADALKTIESPDAHLKQLTKPTLQALIQEIETAAGRPLNPDSTTTQDVIQLANILIPIAGESFNDSSVEVARLAYARLLAGLASAKSGDQPIEAEYVDSVRTRFSRQNQYAHGSVSAEAALAIAESWVPRFELPKWDLELARNDFARARALNQATEANRPAWLEIQAAYLNGLLGARSGSSNIDSLNAETISVAKDLQQDPASRRVAIAAISLADPSSTNHPTDRINDDGTIPTGLPESLHATYLLGAGWNHWNHDQNSNAVSRWRQAARLPALTTSTADSDRDAAARHLLGSLIQLSGVPDQQSSELRYQDRANSIAPALVIAATLASSDAELIADVGREQFICSVAKGDFDDAEQRWNSISEATGSDLQIAPQTGRAIFDLALNRIDAGIEGIDPGSEWYNRLLQSCNAQADPQLFGPDRNQSDRARRTRNDLFRRCYRPTMDRIREQISTAEQISTNGMNLEALTLFCDRFVSLMTQSDRRSAYGAIIPYVRDIELAAGIAAPSTENRNRRTELFYFAADALQRQAHEQQDNRPYAEVIDQLKRYRDQAKTKGTTVHTDCLDAMIAQEEAYREVDPQASLDLSDEAIKNYRNVIFSRSSAAKTLRGTAYAGRGRVLERKAIMMSGEIKETLLDEALDDARRSIELTPEDFQDRESRLENLARVCCEITQITETKKRAEKLELIVEADHAIDEALVIRKQLALDDSQLSTAKLFVLGMIAVVSEDAARNAAVREAKQWMNKTKDLSEQSSAGRIKCAWHYNAAIIVELGGNPETALQHATTAKETAEANLDPSERIAHLATLAYVNLKSYRLSQGSRAEKLALIEELMKDLDDLAKPTPPIANQRDVYRKALEERRKKL